MAGGSKGETTERLSYQPATVVRKAILSDLANNGPSTPREIAARLGMTNGTVRTVLGELYRAVSVSRSGEIGYFKYTLGEQGELF